MLYKRLQQKLRDKDLDDEEIEIFVDKWADDANQEAKDETLTSVENWPFPVLKTSKLP